MPDIFQFIEENSSLIKIALIMIIAILLIILLLIFVIHFTRMRKKTKIPKTRGEGPLEKIEKLKHFRYDARKKLFILDNIVRTYLAGKVRINKKEGYEKIAEKLDDKKESDLADFCERMEYYMFGNIEVSNQDVSNLINKFESLVKSRARDMRIEKKEPEKREIIKKNSEKSTKENPKKDTEIQKFRKLWYPDENQD